MENVAFFESMTPYWVDMQNALHDRNGFEMYYVYEGIYGYDSTSELRSKLHFAPHQMSGKAKNALRLGELYSILKKHQPQIVISIEFSLLTVQLLLIRLFTGLNFKIVVRCDDSYDMLKRPYSRKHAWARNLLSRWVDDIILCDERTCVAFQEKFGKGLYFPIVREEKAFRQFLSQCADQSEKLREKYGLGEKKVVLYVGRIDENKNLSSLIRALSSIDTGSLALVIVGDGPNRENIVRESQVLPCPVIFTGMLSQADLLPWYNVADMFCLVSFKETFGAVVNEALLAGISCIVSYTAGSSHLIAEGKNGYTCDPYSIQDIALKINQLNKDITHLSGNTLRENAMPRSFLEYCQNLRFKN